MPITIEPREDGRILYYTFANPWNLADVVDAFDKDQAYRDRATGTVHALADVSTIFLIPPGSISVGRRAPSFLHRTKGQIAIVGASATVQAIFRLFVRILGIDEVKFFGTPEEGMTFLRQAIAQENHDEDANQS